MTTYTVGISTDKKIIHVAAGAASLPATYINIGTYDHDEADDPLGEHAEGHVMVNHVREILGRTSWADPNDPALWPENITDLSALKIYEGATSAPVRVTSPAITGTAQVGQLLTCSAGAWTGPTVTLARRWFANGVVIAGATAATYSPVVGQIGQVITCEVTPSNTYGTGTPFVTAATAAVIAA